MSPFFVADSVCFSIRQEKVSGENTKSMETQRVQKIWSKKVFFVQSERIILYFCALISEEGKLAEWLKAAVSKTAKV